MTTLTLIVVLIPVAWILWKLLSKLDKSGEAWRTEAVSKFAVLRWRPSHLSAADAKAKAEDLRTLRISVISELTRIYGESSACNIDTLTLDCEHPKPAEWTHIHARKLAVNPRFSKHRAHFAEEIHNLYRVERFGFLHRYKPIDAEDHRKRELAQEFCRGL